MEEFKTFQFIDIDKKEKRKLNLFLNTYISIS